MVPKQDTDEAGIGELVEKAKEAGPLQFKWLKNPFDTQMWRSVFRHKVDDQPRNRSLAVLSNVFLHLHPAKVNRVHIIDDVENLNATIGALGAGLTAIGGFSTTAKGQINTEVVDVLRTDTATELSGVPAASPNLHAMVQFVYMKIRNKETQTATVATINNDAGSAIGTSTTSDDATTYTKGEYA